MKFQTCPAELMVRLRDQYGLQQFVETGTGNGDTAVKACEYFDLVTTCEIDRARASMLRAFLPKPKPPKQLLIVPMDSPVMLGQVFANPACLPALVWLDAHYSGGVKLGPECPLLRELTAVGGTRGRHVILIDDYRLFANPPPPPHDSSQWPTMQQIRDAVAAFDNDAVCNWRHGDTLHVEGDIIVIEPGEIEEG